MRTDAIACLRAGVEAVEPEAMVRRYFAGEVCALGPGGVFLVALGKASGAMSRGALAALSERGIAPKAALALVPENDAATVPDAVRAYGAGHPQPNEGSVRGAQALCELAQRAGVGDTLLVLISGGGSSLSTMPPEGVSSAEVRETTELLLRAGATIGELNCVRKHLDQLKGGRLARLASPARVLALVLSDVVGDRLDVIASGPVSPDPTTFADALRVIDRYRLRERLPQSVRQHLEAARPDDESPDGSDATFENVEAQIVGSNRVAAEAALAEAVRRGYVPQLLTTTLTGEARRMGRSLALAGCEAAKSGVATALLAAGETTVTVLGHGHGGRNQEVALGAALALDGQPDGHRVLVAALGTDGIDGPTDAAGATADGQTMRRGREAGLDGAASLANNDAYTFFAALDDLILTGPTGTNVMDLYLVLVASGS